MWSLRPQLTLNETRQQLPYYIYLFVITYHCVNEHNIDYKKVIGKSFNRAAINMRDEYNGLHAHVRADNLRSVHI